MKTAIDQDMVSLTQMIFGEVLPEEHVTGGLFNHVSKVNSPEGFGI